jgi:hypothetical protein
MVHHRILATASVIAGLAVAAFAGIPAHRAEARIFVGIGVGVPYYYPPPVYYGPPVVYTPPPVVYAPPPVVYAPPAQPLAAPPQSWYYCEDPQGYYPYVQNCNTAWRPVAASPSAAPPR